jgi:hypothetical protein
MKSLAPRHAAVAYADFCQQVESFLTGSCVAGVIQVHEDRVEFARFQDRQQRSGGRHCINIEAFPLQQ